MAESEKVSISRSTTSVAPAGAAAGVVDVAPVTDEAPQRPQTSTKTGVVVTPSKDDANNNANKSAPNGKMTPTAKRPEAKDVDSSSVAADHVKDGTTEDLMEWGEENNTPKEINNDVDSLEDESLKDSLAHLPHDRNSLLSQRIADMVIVDGEGVGSRSDGLVIRNFCCTTAEERTDYENEQSQQSAVNEKRPKKPLIIVESA